MFCDSESPANTSGAAGGRRAALLVAVALVAALLGSSAAGPAAAQSAMASLSGTVSAPAGVSTDGVVVSVVAFCWGGCEGGGQPGGSAGRPRPLERVEFLGETGVNSSGRWSVAVPEPQSQNVSHVNLLVWDEGGVLATRYYFVWDPWGGVEFGDVDIDDADVELEAGGRVSGRFSTSDGGPPPGGDYALWGSGDWLLDVDPQTGEFTSPPVPPGTHRIAHAYHGEGFLGHNAAAEVEVAAGQTADAGTVQIQQAGRITVAIADADGQPLSGVAVSGEISSDSTYWQMPGSPFGTSGTGYFWAATGDDGTHTAQDLYPGDWEITEITMKIQTDRQYTAIAPGSAHTCAIAADQTIDCWGYNGSGEIDAPGGQYTAIAPGESHTCAIAADQTINCWGNNDYGQADAPGGQYTAIAPGDGHTCAIAADGTIDCWGYNGSGQTDAPGGQYTAIAPGESHTCAIAADQSIDCWGYNNYGQADAPGGQYTAIAPGDGHTCAIAADQTIDCWGRNDYGQADAPDGQYTAIATGFTLFGGGHTCAIAADQTVDCWGYNDDGQTNAPTGQYTAIATGGGHSCAIATDQTIDCWGDNWSGQTNLPVLVFDVSAGAVAVASGGTVDCTVAWNGEPELVCSGGQAGGDEDSDDPSDTGDGEDSTDQTDTGDGASDQTDTENSDGGGTEDSGDTSGETDAGDGGGASDPTDTENDSDGGTEDETGTDGDPSDTGGAEDGGAAELCFEVHRFGAEPVDVAKSADGRAVLAQLSWGYHDSIGCYLTLDEDALGVLQAAAAPEAFPAGDAEAAQRCFGHHKFGAEPVDVAKSADRQTVLAQVSWGYHDSFGCYLALDAAATAALRAAHT